MVALTTQHKDILRRSKTLFTGTIFYTFSKCQASVKASPPKWCLSIRYIHVQDVNKILRPCLLIPEQVSGIDDVLKIHTSK
jgi:hypothetical protein